MAQVKYRNRDRDTIIFERQGETVIMSGYGEYYRVGYLTSEQQEKEEIGFIDPSGGPFIQVGDNLADFSNSLKGCIVKSIEIGNQQTIFHV
jgi:hypothetical protein